MSWVKLDDDFSRHRKIAKLSDREFRYHLSALCWCAKNLTDGRVEAREIDEVSALSPAIARRVVAKLVEHRVWDVHPDGGWVIHDYLDFNPSRVQVLTERAKSAARQQHLRDRRKSDAPDDPPGGGVTDFHTGSEANLGGISAESRGNFGVFEGSWPTGFEASTQVEPHIDHDGMIESNAVTNASPPPEPLPQKELKPPPPTPSTAPPPLASVPETGGGGEDPQEEHDAVVDAVVGPVAEAARLDAEQLHTIRPAIAAALARGWPAPALAEHLAADLPDMRRPAALLGKRLKPGVLPQGPARCSCRGCTHWRRMATAIDRAARAAAETAVAREVQAQRDELAAAAAVEADRRADRIVSITNQLGSDVVDRLVTAALAARRWPANITPMPGVIRSILVEIYTEHDWDPVAIRAAVGQLTREAS